jgi:hypothetical protein
MAHFYGDLKGRFKPATKCGSKQSGMTTHIRSWTMGIKTICEYDEINNRNVFKVFLTGGSNNTSKIKLIDEFIEHL